MKIPKSMARKIVIIGGVGLSSVSARRWSRRPAAARRPVPPPAPPARTRPSTAPSWINTALPVTTNARPSRRTVRSISKRRPSTICWAMPETWERVLRKLSVRAMPPPGIAASDRSRVRGLYGLAGRVARSRLGRQEHPGPLRRPSSESRRICERSPRPARRRHRRVRSAADRRRGVRVRQHRDGAQNIAAAAGRIRERRAARQRDGRRRSAR